MMGTMKSSSQPYVESPSTEDLAAKLGLKFDPSVGPDMRAMMVGLALAATGAGLPEEARHADEERFRRVACQQMGTWAARQAERHLDMCRAARSVTCRYPTLLA
jgi:hypothetical protein